MVGWGGGVAGCVPPLVTAHHERDGDVAAAFRLVKDVVCVNETVGTTVASGICLASPWDSRQCCDVLANVRERSASRVYGLVVCCVSPCSRVRRLILLDLFCRLSMVRAVFALCSRRSFRVRACTSFRE